MNQKKFSEKQLTVSRKGRFAKTHYRILVGLLIIGIINYYFFDPNTIGHDDRYTLYVIALPTISGMLVLAWLRKAFLRQALTGSDKLMRKLVGASFLLIQGILFSFLSVGLISKITFNYINSNIAKQNPTEIITCEVTRFWEGRRPAIEFTYQNRPEKFRVRRSFIKQYANRQPGDFRIEISARKGLWNFYIVDKWMIKSRR